jgi:hypothetical protein
MGRRVVVFNDNNARFRLICKQMAKDSGSSLNKLFDNAASYKCTPSWLRDRYHNRIRVREEDIDKMLVFLNRNAADLETAQNLSAHRSAVLAMCLACDGGEDLASASCWDNTCPLRKVSPLPFKPDAGRLP